MKVQDINPFGVRMPAELKQLLDFEAKKNSRSLNSEVVARLWESLGRSETANSNLKIGESSPPAYGVPLNDTDKAVLAIFRRLPPKKQLALLSLLR